MPVHGLFFCEDAGRAAATANRLGAAGPPPPFLPSPPLTPDQALDDGAAGKP